MAGSLKWFVYTDDFGALYALFTDESNVETTNTGGDYTGTPPLVDALPRNVKPRYAVYGTTDGTREIKIPILTPATYTNLSANTPTITDPIRLPLPWCFCVSVPKLGDYQYLKIRDCKTAI